MFHYYKQIFSELDIEKLKNENLIAIGDDGGLLIGNSHDNGGIKMLFKCELGYELLGEIEGDEYVLNWESCIIHRKRLEKINNSKRDKRKKQKTNDLSEITLIDCTTDKKPYTSKYLIFDCINRPFFVNKFSTNIYLKELEKLNRNSKVFPNSEYLNNYALRSIDIENHLRWNRKKNIFKRIFKIN